MCNAHKDRSGRFRICNNDLLVFYQNGNQALSDWRKRQYFIGVDFDVRKLNVGDFLWVAREKVSPIPGSCTPFELVFSVSCPGREN